MVFCSSEISLYVLNFQALSLCEDVTPASCAGQGKFKAAIQNSEQSIDGLNVAETSIPSHNVTHYY